MHARKVSYQLSQRPFVLVRQASILDVASALEYAGIGVHTTPSCDKVSPLLTAHSHSLWNPEEATHGPSVLLPVKMI